MTHIDKNYGPIILGNYIGHQEIHIDKQLNIVNKGYSDSETFRQAESGSEPVSETDNGRSTEEDCTGTNNRTETDNGRSTKDRCTGTNNRTKTDNGRGTEDRCTGTAGKSPAAYMGKRVEHIFNMAEERGLLSQVEDGYVWHENNTLLDYFLGRALCGDYPFGDDKPCWRFTEERKVMPADDMNRLFGRKDIGAIRRVRKMSSAPKGHERIDEIIDESM